MYNEQDKEMKHMHKADESCLPQKAISPLPPAVPGLARVVADHEGELDVWLESVWEPRKQHALCSKTVTKFPRFLQGKDKFSHVSETLRAVPYITSAYHPRIDNLTSLG